MTGAKMARLPKRVSCDDEDDDVCETREPSEAIEAVEANIRYSCSSVEYRTVVT
jgi:hypothetical protein